MRIAVSQLLLAIAAMPAICGCTGSDEHLPGASGAVAAAMKIHYQYDELGRLVQAASDDGIGVQYSYDAEGNITAIHRLGTSTLRLVDFAPRTGTVGSAVTVFGSGFNPTASENTVTFNGTTTGVDSATQTTMVVHVPAGATTGRIAVSNAGGSATSDTDFVVSETSSAPTIIGFSPHVGAGGTVITLDGTNFDVNADNDNVTLGNLPAVVVRDASSPTATQLRFRAPSGVPSGKVTVTTPFGRAVSTDDFIGVPGGISAADVTFTTRLTVDGPPVTVTISASGKKALVVFDVLAGQRLHLLTTASTFSSNVTADVYRHDGVKIDTLAVANNGTADFAQPIALDDTYTAVIIPSGLGTGSAQLRLVSDPPATLPVDASTPVNLSAGQNAHFSFTAEAGTGYGLALSALVLNPSGGITATLRKANGAFVTNCSFATSGSCDLSPANFATSGTYLLDFDPNGQSAATFNAVLTKDAGGVIAVDSAPVAVPIDLPGKNARYTFTGTAGQLATLVLTSNTLDDDNAVTINSTAVSIFKPSSPDTEFTGIPLPTNQTSATLDLALPETGTYSLVVNPKGLDHGTVNVQLTSYATGSLAMNGTTPVSLSAGQNGRFSFTGDAGRGYGIAITGLSFTPPGATMIVTLRKADGGSLANCSLTASGSCDFSPASFATTGTYLLDFDPSGLSAASFNLLLSQDASGAITVDATDPTVVTIERAGQNARYTFSGTAGQLATLVLTGNTLDDGIPQTINGTNVSVFKPSSPNVNEHTSVTINTNQAGLPLDLVLPETGTYTLLINPRGLDQGSINVEFKSYASGTLAVNGTTPVSLSAGRNARLSFTGEAGKGYGIALTGLTFTPPGANVAVMLRKADGGPLTSCSLTASGSCDFSPASFATTGTYLLDFDPSGLSAASFNLLLSQDAGGAITVDATDPTVVTIERAGQNARYTFSGTAGQLATLVLTGNTLDDGIPQTNNGTTVSVFKPSSPNVSEFNGTNINTDQTGMPLDLVLPETGTYTLLVNPRGLDQGSINVEVKSYASGTLAVNGTTPVNLSAGRNARLSFTGEAGKGYGIALTGLSFTPPGANVAVTLRKADGGFLTGCSFGTSGSCDFSPTSFATTGTYLLDFDPNGLSAASFNLLLSRDAGGTIPVDAIDPTVVAIERAGQNARYTLSGTAGQRVSLVLTGNALDDGNGNTNNSSDVVVFKPSGPNTAQLDGTTINTNESGKVLDLLLSEAGSYTVLLNPKGLDQGSINIQVKSYLTGSLPLDSSTTVSLSAGQNARFTFSADAGKGYGLAVTDLTFAPAGATLQVTVRKSDGTFLMNCPFTTSGSCDLNPTSFATTGTYLLDFDPNGLSAAAFNIVLSSDVTGSVVVDGFSAPVTIERPGQNARYTFSGTAGQAVSIVLSGNTLGDGNSMTVNSTEILAFKPSSPSASPIGSGIVPSLQSGTSFNLTLPETGSYTVLISPKGLDQGTIDLAVRNR